MTDSRSAWEARLRRQVGLPALPAPTKPNKFHAKKVITPDGTFDSLDEARRWQELCLLQKAGEISGLVAHEKFDLVVRGKAVTSWRPDFTYTENGVRVVEDFKSAPTRTKDYRIRVKLFRALYPSYQVRESER